MTDLQAAIERVRNRFSWVVCDTDAGTALLTVLAEAARVPDLEVHAARYKALKAFDMVKFGRGDAAYASNYVGDGKGVVFEASDGDDCSSLDALADELRAAIEKEADRD